MKYDKVIIFKNVIIFVAVTHSYTDTTHTHVYNNLSVEQTITNTFVNKITKCQLWENVFLCFIYY